MNHKRLHYFFNIKIIISSRPLLPIVKRFYGLMNFLVSDFIVNQNLRFNIHDSWIMIHHHKYSSSTISERKKSNEIYDKLFDHFACIRTYCAGTIFEKTNFWRVNSTVYFGTFLKDSLRTIFFGTFESKRLVHSIRIWLVGKTNNWNVWQFLFGQTFLWTDCTGDSWFKLETKPKIWKKRKMSLLVLFQVGFIPSWDQDSPQDSPQESHLYQVTWSRWALSFRIVKRVLAITYFEWKTTTFFVKFPHELWKNKIFGIQIFIFFITHEMIRLKIVVTFHSKSVIAKTHSENGFETVRKRCYLCHRALQRAEVNRNA